MAGSEKYWADALALSPGKQLASMQEQMFASETTDGLMSKFDRSIISMTAGIVDPTELQAAQMRPQLRPVSAGAGATLGPQLRPATVARGPVWPRCDPVWPQTAALSSFRSLF